MSGRRSPDAQERGRRDWTKGVRHAPLHWTAQEVVSWWAGAAKAGIEAMARKAEPCDEAIVPFVPAPGDRPAGRSTGRRQGARDWPLPARAKAVERARDIGFDDAAAEIGIGRRTLFTWSKAIKDGWTPPPRGRKGERGDPTIPLGLEHVPGVHWSARRTRWIARIGQKKISASLRFEDAAAARMAAERAQFDARWEPLRHYRRWQQETADANFIAETTALERAEMERKVRRAAHCPKADAE